MLTLTYSYQTVAEQLFLEILVGDINVKSEYIY